MNTGCFAVIYSFEVKPGQADSFEENWVALTNMFYEYTGSLGSRLHKTTNHSYIAYAQWPSRKAWQQSALKLPPKGKEVAVRMRSCCEQIEVLFELGVTKDLLRSHPSPDWIKDAKILAKHSDNLRFCESAFLHDLKIVDFYTVRNSGKPSKGVSLHLL